MANGAAGGGVAESPLHKHLRGFHKISAKSDRVIAATGA